MRLQGMGSYPCLEAPKTLKKLPRGLACEKFYIARVFLRHSLVKFFGKNGHFKHFRNAVLKFLFRRRLQHQNCISNTVFGKNLSVRQVLGPQIFADAKNQVLQHFPYRKCCKKRILRGFRSAAKVMCAKSVHSRWF